MWQGDPYNETPVPDPPTEHDVFARYHETSGIGPGDKKTQWLVYRSASGHLNTGGCSMAGIEELQVGVGPNAKVYRIDEVNGGAVFDDSLVPITQIPERSQYLQYIEDY